MRFRVWGTTPSTVRQSFAALEDRAHDRLFLRAGSQTPATLDLSGLGTPGEPERLVPRSFSRLGGMYQDLSNQALVVLPTLKPML